MNENYELSPVAIREQLDEDLEALEKLAADIKKVLSMVEPLKLKMKQAKTLDDAIACDTDYDKLADAVYLLSLV